MAKIINAVFGGGLFATTAKVFQYDVGDKLRFLGVDLPEGYSVDFANSRTGASTTVYGSADGVTIPPEFFIPGTEIYAWVVISDADGHYTRYQAKIPIYERASRSSAEPTPAQADALDDAITALNSAVEDVEDIADGIPDQIDTALAEAKASGEFDGPQGPQGAQGPQGESGTPGNSIWRGGDIRASGTTPYYFLDDLSGRADVAPVAGDLIVSNIFWLWQIKRIVNRTVYVTSLGSIKGETGPSGEDGYSPTVTVTEISGGHRVTITDAEGDHVFDVMDGQGGGTSDYSDLTNKPQIGGVTLSGNKSAADVGAIAAPEGGSVGQVLKKTASGTEWANESGGGLTEDIKQALLQIAQKVAYIDDQGAAYYQDLYDALYPPAELVSISATYIQSGTVYPTTPLDDLKTDLVVTGTYDDQTTATIPASGYTLSGTLTVGTSTITVTSGGKTATFSVTVTAAPTLSSITAVYTQSGTVYDTDALDSLKVDLVVTAHYSDSSTAIVPATDYTLSGTLTEGTSTITVSYGGKTTTFNVAVTSGTLSGYTSVGSPTITDGILSVADGKFVKSNVAFSPGSSPWRITCKYRNTTGSYSSYTDILGSVDSANASYRSLLLESAANYGGSISMYLSSNGTSWDIGSGNATQANNIPKGQDVWVWLDFSYTGSAYELKYSSDGSTYTLGKSYSSSTPVVDGYAVGFGLKRNGYLQGEIDLNECKIYIDGALWWKAIA